MKTFVLAALALTASPMTFARKSGNEVLYDIVDVLKDSLETIDDVTMYAYMKTHYKTLRLMNEDGTWNSLELGAISDFLLPATVTVADAEVLIDKAATAIAKNDYLIQFLETAGDKSFPILQEKVDTEGDIYFPMAISYAMVQESLAQAVYEDSKLLSVLKNIFIPTRNDMGIMATLKMFSLVKAISVDGVIDNYIQYFEDGKIPEDYGQHSLPLNIMEAVATDIGNDNVENAYTGTVLAFNKPEHASFSVDNKAIEVRMPEPKLWADLYTLWNLAFVVSSFPDWMFVMVKLLIPQVMDHEDNSEAYVYNRAVALYTHLHFGMFSKYDAATKGGGVPAPDWYDPDLIAELGEASFKSSKKYEGKVGHWAADLPPADAYVPPAFGSSARSFATVNGSIFVLCLFFSRALW